MSSKPQKPYPDFPLYAHANGQWAKKINGKTHSFGVWADPDAAHEKYCDQRHDLQAGRVPRSKSDKFPLYELVNHFLTAKLQQLNLNELSRRTFSDYSNTCGRLIEILGREFNASAVDPLDFLKVKTAFAKGVPDKNGKPRGRGIVAVGNQVRMTRILFTWGYEFGLLKDPVRFGPEFRPPSKSALRRERSKKEKRLFSAEQIHLMLGSASIPLKAMILLGVNCGFGNNDCGELRREHLDLGSGWVDFERPKTGVHRRCPLWPETVNALNLAIRERPKAKLKSNETRVFITRYGNPWSKRSAESPISLEIAKLTGDLGFYRKGVNFYALRHTFETVGGGSRDQVAVNFIMGHADASMAATYREGIEDSRLLEVSEFVRTWLFSCEKNAKN